MTKIMFFGFWTELIDHISELQNTVVNGKTIRLKISPKYDKNSHWYELETNETS